MAKKFYTCIIVPDASHRLHKLRIPTRLLHVLAIIGVLLFFVAVGLAFNYTRMAFKVADYDKLQAENTELKIETKNLEVSAKKLSTKINDLENLSVKLTKMIEGDAVSRRFARINFNRLPGTAGGSRENYSTAELIGDNLKSHVDLMRDRMEELEGHFRVLEQVTERRAEVLRQTPGIWPLHGRVASHFGTRIDPFTGDPEMHMGIDIVGMYGSAVRAPADGVVIYAQRKSAYGNLIILDHGNGLTTRHGHLSRFTVRIGQKVQKGDIIGNVGMTGRTTGPHLHYEVRLNDRPVNPRSYLPRGD